MPYISSERVSEIRQQIKNEFAGWKVSIRNDNGSTVVVTILEAPYNLLPEGKEGYYVPNKYYLQNSFQGQALADMERIKEIVNQGNGGFEDSDYGFVPDWYFNIQIGSYDKPFHVVEQKIKTAVQTTPAINSEGSITIVDYSDKAIAVFGPTKPIKEQFIKAGGRPNFNLKYPGPNDKTFGWIFPKTKREVVEKILKQQKI